MKLIFWLFAILIIYTMVGYPLVLELLNKIKKEKKINLSYNYHPSVSIIVPAHNEEAVIEGKLKNLLSLDYNDYEIIIASDNSSDKTNEIVKEYMSIYPNIVKLVEVKERKGKTNAQNEAVDQATGTLLVLTDANSFFDKSVLSHLASFFNDDSIAYVAGKLIYTNGNDSETSEMESRYWNFDLRMRQIESRLSSITAGNGSVYAVRKCDYIKIDPVYSHDSVFPVKYVLNGKRSVYNDEAIAYEKAGETETDEFNRKVRMARKNISLTFLDFQKYNFQKFGMFSFFYLSHRAFRNNLYLFHLIVFFANAYLAISTKEISYVTLFIIQILIYIITFFKLNQKNKILRFLSYYVMTLAAQLVGAINELTGKSKPFWEKAESTR